MGNSFEGEEKGIEIVQNLPDEAKQLLSHHLRNSLAGILGGLFSGSYTVVKESAEHMVDDLGKFGL